MAAAPFLARIDFDLTPPRRPLHLVSRQTTSSICRISKP
jgi:hypothetical protein